MPTPRSVAFPFKLILGCVAAALCLPSGPLRAQAPAAVSQPAALLTSPPSPAPQTQHRDALRLLDAWLEAQVAFDRVPAVSAGVVVGPALVWSKGYGTIDERKQIPASDSTVYSICSISKLFTAIAVMQLWEAGKLSLDDDIGKYLPGFAIQRTDPDSGPITLRSVLTHSSGLPREADADYWSPPNFSFPSREAMMKGLAGQRTFMRTSDHYAYSNLGIALAGEVVAAVSGMPYEDYVQGRILQPLQLTDTRTSLPMDLYGQRLAVGYGPIKRDGTRDLIKPFDTKGLTPAAGFTSTVSDLARFASWQFRLHKAGGSELLKVATLRDMQRVQWTDPDGKATWGLGFAVGRDGANALVSHTGHCPGYRTAWALALKDEVGVIALTNANNAGPYTRQMRQIVLKGLRLPTRAPVAGSDPLESFAGRYDGRPWDSELVILPWGNDLAALGLPTNDPAGDMVVLRRTAGDTFRAIRPDGSLGDEVAFKRDAAGAVVGYAEWSRFVPKLAP